MSKSRRFSTLGGIVVGACSYLLLSILAFAIAVITSTGISGLRDVDGPIANVGRRETAGLGDLYYLPGTVELLELHTVPYRLARASDPGLYAFEEGWMVAFVFVWSGLTAVGIATGFLTPVRSIRPAVGQLAAVAVGYVTPLTVSTRLPLIRFSYQFDHGGPVAVIAFPIEATAVVAVTGLVYVITFVGVGLLVGATIRSGRNGRSH